MIYVDLDRFKMINDNYGHCYGDELLRMVAKRLVDACEPGDCIARLGGDEFAIVRRGAKSRESLSEFASVLVDVLVEEYTVDDTQLIVGASAGICLAPEDCEAGPALMNCSDIAMYYSKASSRSKAVSYTHLTLPTTPYV